MALAKIAVVRTVGGIVFPGSPLAAKREELERIAGFWPDIGKSRTEARRLLQEAGAEGLSFELLNRDLDQPFKYVGTWLVDQWSKIGLTVTQRVVPVGPWFEAMRNGSFDVTLEGNCQSVINPVLDVQKYLPRSVFTENYGNYEDRHEIDLYQQMLHETDPVMQRDLVRAFEKYVLDDQAHELFVLWQHRIAPHRSYVKGWTIGPSFYVNQDLATIWLDK
jgi:peptide/nickel transport system substrate-binding protein